jgi:hypothetical protein
VRLARRCAFRSTNWHWKTSCVSIERARREGRGLRLKLSVLPPELSTLPWEFLYDPRQAEYICLSQNTPIVRYLDLPQPPEPLSIAAPLRVLAMVAAPSNLAPLDTKREHQRLERAITQLQTRGMVELHWLEGQTWRALHANCAAAPGTSSISWATVASTQTPMKASWH